mmetsp:Transcript_44187/g.32166  ORF Transcript_44187/g.32166 Transcript_44187/m.32166 type:complete len:83 (-) Transcript_44187:1376-1624(-)
MAAIVPQDLNAILGIAKTISAYLIAPTNTDRFLEIWQMVAIAPITLSAPQTFALIQNAPLTAQLLKLPLTQTDANAPPTMTA